jgi:hypothetical protein
MQNADFIKIDFSGGTVFIVVRSNEHQCISLAKQNNETQSYVRN